jgi:CDP-glucose 4,6-dehydratase
MENLVVTIMNFWKDKRVLITGHTGFKGGWLALWLKYLGASVSGISLPAQHLSLYHIACIEEELSSHYCDITQSSKLLSTIQAIQPEIIFHLAAQALVRPSYSDPISTFATNIMGTVNLLDAARHCESVKSIIIITSDKCYDNQEWHWGYRETDALGGKDPYSCSKAGAELVANSYRYSFFNKRGVGIATARAGNVIGGGDWGQDRLLPVLVSAFSERKQMVIRNPLAIRPWQHVCEPLNGYLNLARKLFDNSSAFGQAWNFGPYDKANKTVGWIADYVQRKWPESLPWKMTQEDNPHEAQILKLDNSKAKTDLDWDPVLPVEHAIDWTVNWYKAWLKKQNMKDFTLKQIQDFIGLIESNNSQ